MASKFTHLEAAYRAAEAALADAYEAQEALLDRGDDVPPGLGEATDARVEDAERAVAEALAAWRADGAAILAHLEVNGEVDPNPAQYDADAGQAVVAMVTVAGWYADDGNGEAHFGDAESASEACRAYVDSGSWGDVGSTTWVRVRAWQRLIIVMDDGRVVHDDESLATWERVAIEPDEPPCADGHRHDFVDPHWLVGGCKESPGVVGNGAGVIMRSGCRHCGCGRVIDTWAQDPEDGTQGLTSTRYAPGAYAAEFRARGKSAAEDADLDDGEADLSDKGALYREGYTDALRARGAIDVVIDDAGLVRWIAEEDAA